jgi:hypothetical protein
VHGFNAVRDVLVEDTGGPVPDRWVREVMAGCPGCRRRAAGRRYLGPLAVCTREPR